MSDTITKDEARRLIEDIYLREARDMLCVSNGIEAGTILNERVTKALQELEQMPSAQPETAKRIVGKSRDGMTFWYQCDMCNESVDAQDIFCRGCGRRLTE